MGKELAGRSARRILACQRKGEMLDLTMGVLGLRLFSIGENNTLASAGIGGYIYEPGIEYYRVGACFVNRLTQIANRPDIKTRIWINDTEITQDIIQFAITQEHIMENCNCGFYAYNALNPQVTGTIPAARIHRLIWAFVGGFGEVVLHEGGWRAEYLKIHSFVITPFFEWYGFMADPKENWENIAIEYGKPIMGISQAIILCEEQLRYLA